MYRAVRLLALVALRDHGVLFGSEKQRDTPNAGKRDQGVNNSCQNGRLTAADPSHDIKRKQTDATPVQCTDNGKDKGNFVNDHLNDTSFFFARVYPFVF